MQFLLLSLLSFTLYAAKTPSAPIDQVQKNWDTTQSYQADFVQVIYSKRLGTREETKGKILVKKPGRLRWEAPEENRTQILNGKQFWNIHPQIRRKNLIVDYYKDVSAQIDLNSFSFLADKVNLKKTYNINILEDKKTSIQLKLTPKKGSQDTYIAEIIKPSYVLGALTTETAETRVRIEFKEVKTNVVLEDSLFLYKPTETDVVHEQ